MNGQAKTGQGALSEAVQRIGDSVFLKMSSRTGDRTHDQLFDRHALYQFSYIYVLQVVDGGDSGPESACSQASDGSWESLSTHDSSITLWIPDHAALACALCNSTFQILRRKHHCRYLPTYMIVILEYIYLCLCCPGVKNNPFSRGNNS